MRYALVNAAGLFYTGNTVLETIYVPRVGNPREADPRGILSPDFTAANVSQALKFDTEADATAMLSHADLKDPAAFAGCSVVAAD